MNISILKLKADLRLLVDEGYKMMTDYHSQGEDDWRFIPKLHGKPGESPFSDEFPGSWANSYTIWWQRAKKTFESNYLDYDKFRARTELDIDLPNGLKWFKAGLKLLEDALSDDKLLKSLIDSLGKRYELDYRNGVVYEGLISHKFRDDQYIKLFDILWEKRRVLDSNGSLIKQESPLLNEIVYNYSSIRNREEFDRIANGVRKLGKKFNFQISLHSPSSRQTYLLIKEK